jgi:adenosylhomocysteine nucleosidase
MAQKVDGLLVLGVSGGLDPALEPGTLVVADRVLHYYNDRVSRIWQGSSSVCRQAQNNLKARQLTTRIGDILTMPQSVLSVRNKQLLFHQLGALTVDTESAAAAFAADQNHLPFFTMRVVCDPARQAMSPEINSIVNIDGKIKPLYLVNCLFRNPLLITELFCLAKQYPKAMSSLRRGFHILANSGIFLF